jgi:peptidyl-prolyl cis-trans isomerase SurA
MNIFYPLFFVTALLTISLNSEAKLIDKTIALVNADVILQSDLTSFRKNFSLRKELDPFLTMQSVSLEGNKEAQEYLVQEKLVIQKQSPTEDEIEEEINAVQRNNKIDRNQLKDVLKSQGVKFEDYRYLMLVSVAKRKLVDRELRALAAVSDEDVKNYYYTDPALKNQRDGNKLVLSYSLQQLILPNQNLANAAHKRIAAGEDFDSVTADLSGKGAESSSLKNISEENLNGKIRESIQGLRVGEATKPISAGSGYMILKITEVGAPKDPVFEKEKDRIRGILFQKALITQLKLWTEREKAASYVKISST